MLSLLRRQCKDGYNLSMVFSELMSSSSVLANSLKCNCTCNEQLPGYAKINDPLIKFTSTTNLPIFIINPSIDSLLPVQKHVKLKKSDLENMRELSLANDVCRVLSMLFFFLNFGLPCLKVNYLFCSDIIKRSIRRSCVKKQLLQQGRGIGKRRNFTIKT